MNAAEVSVLVGSLVTLLGAIGAIVKLKPDRDAILITSAQGATTILNDLVKTLREEISRLHRRVEELEQDLDTTRKSYEKCQEELEVLRDLAGRRHSDKRSTE